jgi:predicted aspartyl protease
VRVTFGKSLDDCLYPEAVGTFTYKLTLHGVAANGAQRPARTLDALVDTGAMFTSVPAEVLEELGVKPFRTMPVKYANGESADVPMGEIEAELDGQRMPILVLFGAKGVPALLGAHALEAFLLMVDPISKKLVRHEAFLM